VKNGYSLNPASPPPTIRASGSSAATNDASSNVVANKINTVVVAHVEVNILREEDRLDVIVVAVIIIVA
jgi:hypothetical protein